MAPPHFVDQNVPGPRGDYGAGRELDARPLVDAVGVEMRGVDVAGHLDDSTNCALRAASSRHGGVLFRDQSLNAPGLVRFSGQFSRLAHSGNQRYSAPDARSRCRHE